MQIIDLKALSKMPIGTLYCGYINDMLTGDWNVITGRSADDRYFISTLPLNPTLEDGDTTPYSSRITNWATTDTCSYDYNDNELFAVFSKTEIRALITVLQYALSNCNFPIYQFMSTYYCGENEIKEEDLKEWEEEL